MLETQIILLSLAAMGAAFVQRVSGFGFGIFIMTILPYLMPSYGEATTLSGMLAGITSLTIVVRHYRHLVWSKLAAILATFLVISFFAVEFVSFAGGTIMRYCLGVVLILASIWFLFLAKRVTLPCGKISQIGLGTLSGIMGGLFGMQGPPAVLYFVNAAKTKEEYLVMAQMYFLIGNIVMTVYRAYNGFLTTTVFKAWIYGIAATILGTLVGTFVFRRMSMPILKTLIYIYMAVSGIICFL